ncbi:histidine phosphatase family protein [Janibacter massiliensis]|uniref:histidine phosphatase family protein n=1 Tax=Janibacter massiliensis TaxID=2058291 RepID=UPI00131A4AD4|nr:histidine phosphatase family protein [Janibacter massiliensis]
MSRILLVRHGQASWGRRDYDVLSARGHEQARLVGAALAERGVVPDVLVHGGMRRQRETAEEMVQAAGWSVEPDVDPGWAEYDHMEVITAHRPAYRSMTIMRADLIRTFQPRRAFHEMYDVATQRWTGGDHDTDYDESFAQFSSRVEGALTTLVARLGARQTGVVVTSAGVLASIVTDLVHGSSQTWKELERSAVNAAVTTLEVTRTGVGLVTFNEHVHLGFGADSTATTT